LESLALEMRYLDSTANVSNGVCVVGRSPSLKRRVKSAIDGVQAAGLEAARVEIDRDEKIVVITGKAMATDTDTNTNPWDEVVTDAAHEKRTA